MRRYSALFISTFLLLTAFVHAQEQETLFGSPVEHGGFGAGVVKLTPINDATGMLVGGYGGWLINHQFMIGAGGYGLVNNIGADADAEAAYSPYGEDLYLEFGYGGLMLEYIIAPHKLVHVNVQALIGGGTVAYRDDWYDSDFGWNDPDHYGKRQILFVFEPAVNAEINITSWFRMHAGVSYLYVTGIDNIIGLRNKDLSGVSGSLALKFGAF